MSRLLTRPIHTIRSRVGRPRRRPGAALVLLATGLTVSLALNVVIYRAADRYYRQLNGTRRDPLGLNEIRVREGAPPVDGRPRVVFFGDSRARQWPAPAGEPRYHFINRGVGAQTSAQVAGRYAAHVAPLAPNVVVVQVCINDLKT